jgi:hypothetical protein
MHLITSLSTTWKFCYEYFSGIVGKGNIGCSERRLIGHSFYRRNFCERAAPLAEKNAAERQHVLRSLISLHNEHRVLSN